MLAAVSRSDATPAGERVAALATAVLGAVACAGLAAWLTWQLVELQPAEPISGGLRPPKLQSCTMLEDGYLVGRRYGAVQADIDRRGRALRCDGMLRPDGAGMRLLFAADEPGMALLFVIGIDGRPDDAPGRELAVNLTIVDEARDRFFNSGLGERCWAQLGDVRLLGRAGRREYRIAGELYCAGALAAVNGPGSVTPAEFRFAGRLSVADE